MFGVYFTDQTQKHQILVCKIYILITWPNKFNVDLFQLLIPIIGPNFKSIGVLVLSKWRILGILRTGLQNTNRTGGRLKFFLWPYLVKTYHWWKNQVKTTCSSWDQKLLERVFYRPARNVYFTDQNQILLKEIVMAYQNRHLVKIWSKLVKSICQNSISGQFKILVCKMYTNRWPKNFPEFWITVS